MASPDKFIAAGSVRSIKIDITVGPRTGSRTPVNKPTGMKFSESVQGQVPGPWHVKGMDELEPIDEITGLATPTGIRTLDLRFARRTLHYCATHGPVKPT